MLVSDSSLTTNGKYTRCAAALACDLSFSPLGKLAGRAVYFADVFSLFLFLFLMVDFYPRYPKI